MLENLQSFILGFFLIIQSTLVFLIAVFFDKKQRNAMFCLGAISVLAGLWFIAVPFDLASVYLYPDKLFWVHVGNIAPSFIPSLLAYFCEQVFGVGPRRIMQRLWQITGMYGLIYSVLFFNFVKSYDIQLFLNDRFMTFTWGIFKILICLELLALIVFTTSAYFKGSNEAKFFTAGFVILIVFSAYGLFSWNFIFAKWGLLFFILSLVLMVAKRFSEAYRRIELYSKEVEVKNIALNTMWEEVSKSRDEIAAMNKTLEQRVAERTEELESTNEELTVMNEQLKNYADTVEELTVTKERNRFARDVHDTLGHTLTLLIKKLEIAAIVGKSDLDKAMKELLVAADMARDGLKEVRRSIAGLMPEKLESSNLTSALTKLVSEFRQNSGVDIHFSQEGIEGDIGVTLRDAIYRTCQEAMTNSVRHGKATHIVILLRLINGSIKLSIFDNGIGCNGISKGYGLTGMEERIHSLGGKIEYGAVDSDSGFFIQVNIPLIGDINNANIAAQH